ncbi:MAG: nitroreductase family protein [Deltaproteobacteria bacterium]|nr:nitroreductase family protein [Deltaproteobacteria bacterium]
MEIRELFERRRAVNFFDPARPVAPDVVREIVTLGARAPSGFNTQPWSLLVLTEPEEKAKLRQVAWNQPKITEAPVVFVVLGDRTGWQAGHPVAERNFQEMVTAGQMAEDKHDWLMGATGGLYGSSDERRQAFACKNAGFFAMALMLAAAGLGVDTHPMDGFDHEGVRAAFHIPESYWIPLLIAVGYRDPERTATLPYKWRKSADEIVVRFP